MGVSILFYRDRVPVVASVRQPSLLAENRYCSRPFRTIEVCECISQYVIVWSISTLHWIAAAILNSANWSNWISSLSTAGSMLRSHDGRSVVENVDTFSVKPPQSYPVKASTVLRMSA